MLPNDFFQQIIGFHMIDGISHLQSRGKLDIRRSRTNLGAIKDYQRCFEQPRWDAFRYSLYQTGGSLLQPSLTSTTSHQIALEKQVVAIDEKFRNWQFSGPALGRANQTT
jgi:hypothetical protein